MKDSDVESGGLAGASRQLEHVRPQAWRASVVVTRVLTCHETREQPCLPRERIEAPYSFEERDKIGCFELIRLHAFSPFPDRWRGKGQDQQSGRRQGSPVHARAPLIALRHAPTGGYRDFWAGASPSSLAPDRRDRPMERPAQPNACR